MEIEIRAEAPRRLVGLRHVGPYWQIGSAFDRLGEWLKAQNGLAGTMVAVYHDDPRETPEAELRSDACIELAAGVEITDAEVRVFELPGADHAISRYVGPYSGLPEAWGEFFSGIATQTGRTPSDAPGIEVYVKNCDAVGGDESQLVTDLLHPVDPV